MRWIRIAALVLAVLLLAGWGLVRYGTGQAWFWEWDVRRIEARDRETPPAVGGIVFTGSSSIRKWNTLARDMAPLPVTNQGFGGSQIPHVTRYAPRIVVPHRPRLVVLYAGDNDLASGAKDAGRVAGDFEAFVRALRDALPGVRVEFLAIKPSLARIDRWPEMRRANGRIEEICADDPALGFIDVATPMLGADGRPRAELFVADGLHLSPEGYALWTGIVRPVLLERWRELSPSES